MCLSVSLTEEPVANVANSLPFSSTLKLGNELYESKMNTLYPSIKSS